MVTKNSKCPYCDASVDVYDHWKRFEHRVSFDLMCRCGRSMRVDVSIEPLFKVSKRKCCCCNASEPVGDGYYCETCHRSLRQLSKHNGGN
jgi:hypothetical protein